MAAIQIPRSPSQIGAATAAQGGKADTALQPGGDGSGLTGLTKAQVGLGSVDNTADSAKPISTAVAAALGDLEEVLDALASDVATAGPGGTEGQIQANDGSGGLAAVTILYWADGRVEFRTSHGFGVANIPAALAFANSGVDMIKFLPVDILPSGTMGSKVILGDGVHGGYLDFNNYISFGSDNGSDLVITTNINGTGGFAERARYTNSGKVGFGTAGPQAGLHVAPPAPDIPTLLAQAASSQSANIAEWRASDGTTVHGSVSENGYHTTRKNAAPADAELVAGEAAFWLDATNGAGKFRVKAKTADGTVVAGSIDLA